MSHGRARVWVKRAGLALGLLVLAIGTYAAFNWTGVSARYAGYRFRTASTDEGRAKWASRLVALGEAGSPFVADAFRCQDEARCAAAVAAIKVRLAELPPTDPSFSSHCRMILDGLGSFGATGKA